MSDRSPRCLSFAAFFLVLFGCGGDEKALQALAVKYGPAIERNLAAWPIIAEQLRTLPPLAQQGVAGEPDSPVDAPTDSDLSIEAALCYAEDLADPDELGYVWGRVVHTGQLNHCASMLHRGHEAYDPAEPELDLDRTSLSDAKLRYPNCAGFRYLFVIRTLEFLLPSSATAATEPFVPLREPFLLGALPAAASPSPVPAKKHRRVMMRKPFPDEQEEVVEKLMPTRTTSSRKETRYLFEGGLMTAELLAFELSSGKLLGRSRFSVQSNVEVEGRDRSIRQDFERQIERAIEKAVEETAAKLSAGTLRGDPP